MFIAANKQPNLTPTTNIASLTLRDAYDSGIFFFLSKNSLPQNECFTAKNGNYLDMGRGDFASFSSMSITIIHNMERWIRKWAY